MSYDRQSIVPVLDAKTGFDRAAKTYNQYRTHLNSVDSNRFVRFLPRDLRDLTILDLWAGDGRIFDQFKNTGYAEYIALDISQGMLDRFQSSTVTKVCADIDELIPLEDNSVDLICMFFVIEYISDIQHLFLEIARILKPGGTCVASYFHQRHAFTFGHAEDHFKIERFPYTYEEIQDAANYAFLTVDDMSISGEEKVVWYIYEFKKD